MLVHQRVNPNTSMMQLDIVHPEVLNLGDRKLLNFQPLWSLTGAPWMPYSIARGAILLLGYTVSRSSNAHGYWAVCEVQMSTDFKDHPESGTWSIWKVNVLSTSSIFGFKLRLRGFESYNHGSARIKRWYIMVYIYIYILYGVFGCTVYMVYGYPSNRNSTIVNI